MPPTTGVCGRNTLYPVVFIKDSVAGAVTTFTIAVPDTTPETIGDTD